MAVALLVLVAVAAVNMLISTASCDCSRVSRYMSCPVDALVRTMKGDSESGAASTGSETSCDSDFSLRVEGTFESVSEWPATDSGFKTEISKLVFARRHSRHFDDGLSAFLVAQ